MRDAPSSAMPPAAAHESADTGGALEAAPGRDARRGGGTAINGRQGGDREATPPVRGHPRRARDPPEEELRTHGGRQAIWGPGGLPPDSGNVRERDLRERGLLDAGLEVQERRRRGRRARLAAAHPDE